MKIPGSDIIFVLAQFILIVVYFLEIQSLAIVFPELIFWIGLVLLIFGAFISLVAVLQLNIHLSPFPSPLPGSKLIDNGIFKFVRHPIYTGVFLGMFGFGIIYDSGYKMIISIVLFLLFYFKSTYEEKSLAQMFPEYPEYANRTGRFFPKIFK